MGGKLGRRRRYPRPREVGGCPHDMMWGGSDLPCRQRGRIFKRAHSQRDVYALLHKVDDPVVENHIHRQVGMRCQELESMRIAGVSRGGFSSTGGVVVGEAWVPSLEQ